MPSEGFPSVQMKHFTVTLLDTPSRLLDTPRHGGAVSFVVGIFLLGW